MPLSSQMPHQHCASAGIVVLGHRGYPKVRDRGKRGIRGQCPFDKRSIKLCIRTGESALQDSARSPLGGWERSCVRISRSAKNTIVCEGNMGGKAMFGKALWISWRACG